MMCLSWFNQQTCKVRGSEQIEAPTGTAVSAQLNGAGAPCPDITWFWLGLAAIAGGMLMKGDRR